MPFHFVQQGALVAGVVTLTCSPTFLSLRALTEADTWTHFRIRSLKFRLLPPTAAPAQCQAAGFVGGMQDTPPASIANVVELIPACVLGSRQTVPTGWMSPSKSELAGPLPWYKTIPGSADTTEESPGQLVIAGSTTEGYVIEYFGVFEFKGAVSTANTPSAIKLREELRALRLARADAVERERLLAVLGTTRIAK